MITTLSLVIVNIYHHVYNAFDKGRKSKISVVITINLFFYTYVPGKAFSGIYLYVVCEVGI